MLFLHLVEAVYVVYEGDCQIWTRFSDAKLRYVDLNGLHDLHDTSTFKYYESKITGVVEREYSKITKNHQTLLSNRISEAPILAQYRENDKDIKLCGKASTTDLDQWPFVP